jgi:serine/threonine-protein kinase
MSVVSDPDRHRRAMDDILERIRRALAQSYDIEREIAAGGMAQVFLARDLKHDRAVAIKVFNPTFSAALGSERFLREISIAARFSHPHILPLHDSGEADGLLYYVMPYVEGESLKQRLDREKPLSVQEAVKIASQVAHALDYAHSHDVVHRDIKPANILISSGEAVVADFGIARAIDAASDVRLTAAGTSTGTPWYMSPEQAAGNDDVDGRSDIYALGCVLYEMLAGTPPFAGTEAQKVIMRQISEAPRPIRQIREVVPESVERALLCALAKLPADRFPAAGEFARALEPSGGVPGYEHVALKPPVSRRGRLSRAAAVLIPVALAAGFFLTRSSEGLGFAERDWILISDLENSTGEEVFDRSLNTALTVAVDQSRYVNVYPRSRVEETLRRMGRDSVPALDEALAREVAVRENLKAVLVFDISRLEETYLLSTRVLAPESGVAVHSETVQVDGKAGVLEGVDDLARRLRANLGESLSAIQERSIPLPQATTSSLEALKNYVDGSVAWSESRWEEARSLWQEAVTEDSMFAWAHASLGMAANWLNGFGSGQPHFERALGLLDRVTEKERLWIRSLIEDGEPMVETLRIYTQLFPDDRDAWYNLGNGLRSLLRHQEALDAYARALEIDSLMSWAHVNSAMAYDAVGRYVDAARSFERAFELDPPQRTQTRGDLNRISGFVQVKTGDTAAARETFELLLPASADERANGLRSLALLDMYGGHLASAVEHLEEAVALTETTGSRLSEYRNRLYLASVFSAKGLLAEAARERGIAETIGRELGAAPFWLAILAKQYARSGDLERAAAVQDLIETRAASGDQERSLIEHIRGEIALARGQHDEAETALETAYGLWRSADGLESLAYSHATSGRFEAARDAYEELLEDMPLGREAQAYWIPAHYHLGLVLVELGERERAAALYRRFLELWGDGDDDIPLVREATARLADR